MYSSGHGAFPATDDDQWTLIKRLIDDCDYYILIVGGRYGSISASGISYTQMEYEYAVEKGIPVISFLHKNPDSIPVGKSESEKELRVKLERFKTQVQQKMCKYYQSSVELGSIVSRSLVRLIKDKPQPGWVKATFVPSEESTKELLELTKQIDQLKSELNAVTTAAPEATNHLSQGDDHIIIEYAYDASGGWKLGDVRYESELNLTWNEIFAEISPLLIDECTESELKQKVNGLISTQEYQRLKELHEAEKRVPTDFKIKDSNFQTLKIQFRALNLIKESIRKRGVHDKASYWTLTAYGDTVMTRLRAIKR